MMDFKSFLNSDLLAVVGELGFVAPTPIQAQSIPHLLAGRDLIGQAQTGSGKTAAFGIPILQNIKPNEAHLQALILCPTRELATQVVREIRKLARRLDQFHVVSLTGGQSGRDQSLSLKNGAQVAVGTPGRVLDLMEKGRLVPDQLQTVVLDEADKMLDMGFEDEINGIFKLLPARRQTALFSATFPESILEMSGRFQKNPAKVVIEAAPESKPDIEQFLYESPTEEKINTVFRVLQQHPAQSTLIFCNMKTTVNELADALEDKDVSCAKLHGDLEQRDRDRVMAMFRNGSHRVLIATDVAARGLDIENLELVINFDFPLHVETYVHRIGRTGRAGKKGVAVSLVNEREILRVAEVERGVGGRFLRKPLGFKNQHGLTKELRDAPMQTLSISGGRKDKLRAGDILGALTGTAGGLKASHVGKIEIHDRLSFVAISSDVATLALQKLREGRIKGHKFQIRFMK